MYNIKFAILIAVLIALAFYLIMSKSYLVAKPVHEQGLRNGKYDAVFKTGLLTQNDNITGPITVDTTLYTSRKLNYINPMDTSITEPKTELLDINPVHYLSTPGYADLKNSMNDKSPLPVASAVKI